MQNKNHHDDKADPADMEDNMFGGPSDYLSNIIAGNVSEPEPTTQSEIMSMWKMMGKQWQMLDNTIQQNTQLHMQFATLM